jgi:hypothetical protein
MKRLFSLVLLSSVACSVAVEAPPIDDKDLDTIVDQLDNCPEVANTAQTDEDGDGIGNPCDVCPLDRDNDPDGDGLCFADDNCPEVANPDQEDTDFDGWGDACDACPDDAGADSDQDSVCVSEDNCPDVANPLQEDGDEDGIGDACDACPASPSGDSDGDGLCDDADNCPERYNPEQVDRDENDQGDACQITPDGDGDGVADGLDNCPNQANVGWQGRSIEVVLQAHPANEVELGDDSRSEALDIGFKFPFFSGWRERVRIHSNGFISFQLTGQNQRYDRAQTLPSEEASRLAVMGFWTDLDPSAGGSVRYGTTGEAPNRIFTVEWDRVPGYGAGNGDPRNFFQIVLYEAGAIDIVCAACVTRGDRTATQGLQNYARNVAVSVPGRNNSALDLNQDALRFETLAQPDADDDGRGDPCDDDRDGDSHLNDVDVCPDVADIDQADSDSNGLGDACNDAEDADGDDWSDELDNCPRTANPNQDDVCSYIRLSGQVLYSDRLYNRQGMTGQTQNRVVPFVRVELLGGDEERILATATADEEGRYVLEAEWVDQENWRIRALAESLSNTPVRVINRSDPAALYSITNEPFVPAPDETIDLIADHGTPAGAAFNILATSVETYRFVRRFTQQDAPRLTIQWAPLESWNCGSCYSRNRIRLGGQEADPDEWDDDVIRHEFAHYFMDRFSHDDSPGGSHNGDRTNPLLAFGEGVATFFGSMASNQRFYIDMRGRGQSSKDLETIGDNDQYRGTGSNRLDGGISEYLVAPLLWDLLDDSGDAEAHDQIALGEQAIMDILLEDLTNQQRPDIGIEGVDIADVVNRAECRHDNLTEPMLAICQERNFPWVSGEDRNCGKAHDGLPFTLVSIDGELVISLEGRSQNLESRWELEGTSGARVISCKSLPCATGVRAEASAQVSLWRMDGTEGISFAGAQARRKALGGRLDQADRLGQAVRSYPSR